MNETNDVNALVSFIVTKEPKVYYPPTRSEVEKGLKINVEYPVGHPKRAGDNAPERS